MSKRLEMPETRLICFGSARACTNAGAGNKFPEDDPGPYYNN
jgi:hypothetical protein